MKPSIQKLKTAFRDHRWLGALCGLYVLLLLVQCAAAGVPLREIGPGIRIVFLCAAAGLAFTLFLFLLLFLRWCGRPATLGARCRDYFTGRLFFNGLAGYLVLNLMAFIGIQKSLIIRLNPYKWDPLFAAWDWKLHFHHHPFQLATAMLEGMGAWGPRLIVTNYALWFPVMFAGCFYCIFRDADFHRRMRFLWSCILLWAVLGSLCAVVFSSVGPLYFHDLYPQLPDPYKDLMVNLYQSREGSKAGGFYYTRLLLLNYARNESFLDFNAISAMPSLHVAIAWLLVLYAAAVSRWMTIFVFIFFLLTLAGSVYLGFHYAIDGYAAVIATSLIWWGSGPWVRRLHPRTRDLNG